MFPPSFFFTSCPHLLSCSPCIMKIIELHAAARMGNMLLSCRSLKREYIHIYPSSAHMQTCRSLSALYQSVGGVATPFITLMLQDTHCDQQTRAYWTIVVARTTSCRQIARALMKCDRHAFEAQKSAETYNLNRAEGRTRNSICKPFARADLLNGAFLFT